MDCLDFELCLYIVRRERSRDSVLPEYVLEDAFIRLQTEEDLLGIEIRGVLIIEVREICEHCLGLCCNLRVLLLIQLLSGRLVWIGHELVKLLNLMRL